MKSHCYRAALLVLGAGCGYGVMAAPADRVRVDGVAAHVNEHMVTLGEVQAAMGPAVQRLRGRFQGAELAEKIREAFEEALNLQIDRHLILDAYQEQKGRIPEWVVDQRIEQIVRDEFKGDRAALMDALFQDRLPFEAWRKDIQDFIIVSSMKSSAVGQNIRISPESIRDYYTRNIGRFTRTNQAHIRMIVLAGDGADEAALKEQAADIRRRLAGGEAFADLAIKFSKGRKAAQGGDWGWIRLDDLQADLVKAIQPLEPGAVSGDVGIGGDLYIVKLEARKETAVTTLDEAQPEIEMELRKEEAERLYRGWMARLKEKAYVKVVPQPVEPPH